MSTIEQQREGTVTFHRVGAGIPCHGLWLTKREPCGREAVEVAEIVYFTDNGGFGTYYGCADHMARWVAANVSERPLTDGLLRHRS